MCTVKIMAGIWNSRQKCHSHFWIAPPSSSSPPAINSETCKCFASIHSHQTLTCERQNFLIEWERINLIFLRLSVHCISICSENSNEFFFFIFHFISTHFMSFQSANDPFITYLSICKKFSATNIANDGDNGDGNGGGGSREKQGMQNKHLITVCFSFCAECRHPVYSFSVHSQMKDIVFVCVPSFMGWCYSRTLHIN